MPLLSKAMVENRLARERLLQTKNARAILMEGSRAYHPGKVYDLFLSHSYSDAREVLAAKLLLEDAHLSVYVDWIEDSHLDRSLVTPKTADHLRHRMENCHSLLYLTTENASRSVWMPWELGYFDGKKGTVAVLPVSEHRSDSEYYDGQEYLGLYPYVTYQEGDSASDTRFFVHAQNKLVCDLRTWLHSDPTA